MAQTRPWYQPTVLRMMALVVFAALFGLLARAVGEAREEARRAQCVCNLKLIGLALHNYHSVYGCFPPAYVVGPDGKPWHSWRVLVWPFIESNPLCSRYNFNEPWDGPNNRTLIGTNYVYSCPTHRSTPSPFTNYVAVVGPGTVFPGAGTTSIADIHDGTANTLMLAECSDLDIPWTEPRDLDVSKLSFRVNDPARPGPSSRHPGGANVVLADGSCRFFKNTIRPKTLKPLFTIRGGETGDPDDY
jgi:prepilin-type processing-associated H-X9-DG protein